MSVMVSILLPTYEPDPVHLREAIESILRQSHADWQLFIHDDASQANVHSMITPYLTDPRITFERSERRLGIGGNWNACIRRTGTDLVQFLFQDDVWEPQYLEKMMDIMTRNPSVGLAAANHRYLFEGTGAPHSIYEEVTTERRKLQSGIQHGKTFVLEWADRGLRPNLVGEPSFVMLRRSALKAAGLFSDTMRQGLDVDMWVRLLVRSDFAWVPEDLGSFRVHTKGASAVNETGGVGLTDRLKCFEALLRSLSGSTDQRHVKRAMQQALTQMIRKYRSRTKTGGGTGGIDRKWLIGFGLRHPVMSGLSLLWAAKEK